MEYEVEGSRPTGRPKRTWRGCVKIVKHVFEQGGCYVSGSPMGWDTPLSVWDCCG